MSISVVSSSSGRTMNRDGYEIRVISTNADLASASCGVLDVKGDHGEVMSSISDRIYYVVSGAGSFRDLSGGHDVSAGDTVIVERGTRYGFEGEMVVYVTHIPAFDPSGETVFD